MLLAIRHFCCRREILRILGENSENTMIDIDKFIFDKVSNVSNYIKLDDIDDTTVN
jgi:hypothetical protein